MTDVAGSRQIIQQESVDFQSAVSEAVMFEIAQLNNFHAFFQHNRRNFLVNGAVNLAAGLSGVDGEFHLYKNVEIVGISYSLGDTGSLGDTTLDVHLIDSAGIDQGSIFTGPATQPTIASAVVGSGLTIIEYFLGAENTLANNSLNPNPVFTTRTFSAGESLRFDVDNGASAARDLTFTLIYRPID